MHCPCCGIELVRKHVEGRLRHACPACGHVVYRQPKMGVGVLVEQEGALLLVKRGPQVQAFPRTWNLPSGYCESDEPPPTAAVRETAEETGLQVEVGRLVDAYYFDDDPRGNGLLLVYEARIVDGKLQVDGWEAAEVGFFSPDALPEPLCGGGHDQAIRAWWTRALDRWQPGEPMRFCPHCAHPLEERVAFDRVRPACAACGFIHFRELKVGVSLLVEKEDQVLLVRRAVEPGEGKWSLPSGFVEWDESPETAAVRECEEETGLEVGGIELLDVLHYTDDFRGPGINLLFRARVLGGQLHPGDDAGAVRFFSSAEIPPADQIAFEGHRATLTRWEARVSTLD